LPSVVGVKIRQVAKVLYFDPGSLELAAGQQVIVETERGREIGDVAYSPRDVEESEIVAPLKPVVRIATEEDLEIAAELREKDETARHLFREAINRHGLDMKPVEVEHSFSGDKATLYFTAEERVDFRALVRDLASELKVRIDMRQIGVRDEARMVGGLGHCGEQLCCVRFGGEFQPVSIRMAKDQDLSLNPLKISGLCGRLMCCLRYETEAYKDFKSRAPKKGEKIGTPMGEGVVSNLNTLRESVTVKLPETGSVTVPLSAMKCGKGKGCPCSIDSEALDVSRQTMSAQTLSVLNRLEQNVDSRAEPSEERAKKPPRPERERVKRDRSPREAKQEPQPAEAKDEGTAPAPRTGRRRRRRRPGGSSGDASKDQGST